MVAGVVVEESPGVVREAVPAPVPLEQEQAGDPATRGVLRQLAVTLPVALTRKRTPRTTTTTKRTRRRMVRRTAVTELLASCHVLVCLPSPRLP